MITLLTGQPGNGKTSFVINQIKKDIADGFNVFTCGIPDLKDLEVTPVSKKTILNWYDSHDDFDIEALIEAQQKKTTEVLTDEEYYDLQDENLQLYTLKYFPSRSKVYVDECQFMFGKMGTRAALHSMALSVHRHFGIDFFFIAQSPSFLNEYLTKNASTHFHIAMFWYGRRLIEYTEVENDPTSKAAVSMAASFKPYKPDPTTFAHYKSATAHIKLKHSIPKKFWIVCGIFILCPIMLYRGYTHFSERFDPKLRAESSKQSSTPQNQSKQIQNQVSTPSSSVVRISACTLTSQTNLCRCFDQNLKPIQKITKKHCDAFNPVVL